MNLGIGGLWTREVLIKFWKQSGTYSGYRKFASQSEVLPYCNFWLRVHYV